MERDIKEQWTLMAIRISTHTLTWSVTLDRDNNFNPTIDFNSHAHVERDRLSHTVPHVPHKISTHTLTWSVTLDLWQTYGEYAISTHTLTWSVTEHC